MNEKIYKPLHLALTAATVVAAIVLTLQVSAPWALQPAFTAAQPALDAECRKVAACQKVRLERGWSASQRRYEAIATIMATRKLSDTDMKALKDGIRRVMAGVVTDNLLYRNGISVDFRVDRQ